MALVLDRVLPWSKALDDCEAFREFTFDTRRWLMRRWNVSERLNNLLIRTFEFNPYRRIKPSSIPLFVDKIDEFVVSPDETKFALQHHPDSASVRRRERELEYSEGRFDPTSLNGTVFADAIDVYRSDSPRKAERSITPHVTLVDLGRSPRKRSPVLPASSRALSPRTEPFIPLPDHVDSRTAGLGLTGVGQWLATGTIGEASVAAVREPLPALDEDEQRMQNALIAAHRLEGRTKPIIPAQSSPRRRSFLRNLSPLRSHTRLPSIDDDNADWPTDDEYDDFDEAPPLSDDDGDDSANSPNSSMPPTPRTRVGSIPELQGAVAVACAPSQTLAVPRSRASCRLQHSPVLALTPLTLELSSHPSSLLEPRQRISRQGAEVR